MIDVNAWLSVPDFPNYEIRIATNDVISLNYWKKWKPKTIKFHQIVARIKYGYWTPEWLEVCHNDWNARNNYPDNLRYDTRINNAKDRVKHWKCSKISPSKWKFWKDNHLSKSTLQYAKEWKFIKEWDSISDINRAFWLNVWNISSCCRWKLKTAVWFKWKYKNSNNKY